MGQLILVIILIVSWFTFWAAFAFVMGGWGGLGAMLAVDVCGISLICLTSSKKEEEPEEEE